MLHKWVSFKGRMFQRAKIAVGLSFITVPLPWITDSWEGTMGTVAFIWSILLAAGTTLTAIGSGFSGAALTDYSEDREYENEVQKLQKARGACKECVSLKKENNQLQHALVTLQLPERG